MNEKIANHLFHNIKWFQRYPAENVYGDISYIGYLIPGVMPGKKLLLINLNILQTWVLKLNCQLLLLIYLIQFTQLNIGIIEFKCDSDEA